MLLSPTPLSTYQVKGGFYMSYLLHYIKAAGLSKALFSAKRKSGTE